MGNVKFLSTPLAGLTEIETPCVADARGQFERVFCSHAFAPLRQDLRFVQANLSSTSHRGTVRGLHYQAAPATEAKLIRCVRGAIYDVAVDLRARSPTFLRWHALELNADEPREIFIPEGFAHGFQALTDDVQLLYLHTAPWSASCEGGVRHDDPAVGVHWPMPPTMISQRDLGFPLLDRDFSGLQP